MEEQANYRPHPQLSPCPFCGSDNLRLTDTTYAEEYGELDIDMVECLGCKASAPTDIWNNRPRGDLYRNAFHAAQSYIRHSPCAPDIKEDQRTAYSIYMKYVEEVRVIEGGINVRNDIKRR